MTHKRKSRRVHRRAQRAGSRLFVPITEPELMGVNMKEFWARKRSRVERAELCARDCIGLSNCENPEQCINFASANAGAVPRRGSDVGTSPLLGDESKGDR